MRRSDAVIGILTVPGSVEQGHGVTPSDVGVENDYLLAGQKYDLNELTWNQ